MYDSLTSEEIEAGLHACEKATAGPWVSEHLGVFTYNAPERSDSERYPDGSFLIAEPVTLVDANLIALARDLLPRALQELRELRRQHDELVAAIEDSAKMGAVL